MLATRTSHCAPLWEVWVIALTPCSSTPSVQSVHVFIDRSVISAIASNETAITAWTHPVAGSVALGLFAEGGAADVELEVWTMGSIL